METLRFVDADGDGLMCLGQMTSEVYIVIQLFEKHVDDCWKLKWK